MIVKILCFISYENKPHLCHTRLKCVWHIFLSLSIKIPPSTLQDTINHPYLIVTFKQSMPKKSAIQMQKKVPAIICIIYGYSKNSTKFSDYIPKISLIFWIMF